LSLSSSKTALPDDGFLRQIWKILADLKVVWRAKKILAVSQFLRVSSGFDQFCMVLFLSGGSDGFWRFWRLFLAKKTNFFTFSCIIKIIDFFILC
jgi:hypothetical protein